MKRVGLTIALVYLSLVTRVDSADKLIDILREAGKHLRTRRNGMVAPSIAVQQPNLDVLTPHKDKMEIGKKYGNPPQHWKDPFKIPSNIGESVYPGVPLLTLPNKLENVNTGANTVPKAIPDSVPVPISTVNGDPKGLGIQISVGQNGPNQNSAPIGTGPVVQEQAVSKVDPLKIEAIKDAIKRIRRRSFDTRRRKSDAFGWYGRTNLKLRAQPSRFGFYKKPPDMIYGEESRSANPYVRKGHKRNFLRTAPKNIPRTGRNSNIIKGRKANSKKVDNLKVRKAKKGSIRSSDKSLRQGSTPVKAGKKKMLKASNGIVLIKKHSAKKGTGHSATINTPHEEADEGHEKKLASKPKTLTHKREPENSAQTSGNAANVVYGNDQNIGIQYGSEPHRLKYSSFRRSNNDLLSQMIKAFDKRDRKKDNIKQRRRRKPKMFLIGTKESIQKLAQQNGFNELISNSISANDDDDFNTGEEIIDEDSYENQDEHTWRRAKAAKDPRVDLYSPGESGGNGTIDPSVVCAPNDTDSDDDSGKSGEKNPGNPYTIFRNKYKQNWLWNHFMDGDHMNINPMGPKFASQGPSGAALFFARKWWYFNQDDYKPFR